MEKNVWYIDSKGSVHLCHKRIDLKGINKLHPNESTWETTQLWKLLAWEMLMLVCQ